MIPPSRRQVSVRDGALASPRARPSALIRIAVALSFGMASPAVAQPSPAPSSSPSASPPTRTQNAHPYAVHVAEAARRFGIPEAWIWSVMRVESAGNPTATSRAGAMGLMQVMPGTYAELRSRHGLGPYAYDPRDNILAGAAYLREMHDCYGTVGMLAAYNAGPGRWEDYLARGRPLPTETIAYMARLGPTVGGSAAPSPTIAMPVDRFAWRRASLFVALDEHAPTSGLEAEPVQDDAHAAAPPNLSAATRSEASAEARSDPSHALFAVRRPE
jgi:soluble lytic murein transglycosylase-like protein